MNLNVLGSVDIFAHTTLPNDINRIASAFGIEPTSDVMVKLTGTNASSLSRALNERTSSVRTFAHIAVLAALASELEAYLEAKYPTPGGGTKVEPSQMRRWLICGSLDTDEGPLTPLEALSDPDRARAALYEVRNGRAAPRSGSNAETEEAVSYVSSTVADLPLPSIVRQRAQAVGPSRRSRH
jgi:hypothetical protein